MDKETYDRLIDDLIRYSESYYKANISLISDEQFDLMLKQAEQIEKEHPSWLRFDSPTLSPGSDLSSADAGNAHRRPMLSLENTYNEEDVARWYQKMKEFVGADPEVVVEYKFDGNSAGIRFAHGKVVKALTRGNGVVGEDITANVNELEDLFRVKSFFSGECRGEIIMPKEEFARLNVEGKYANARNLASGTIKLLDVEEFPEAKTLVLRLLAGRLQKPKAFGRPRTVEGSGIPDGKILLVPESGRTAGQHSRNRRKQGRSSGGDRRRGHETE